MKSMKKIEKCQLEEMNTFKGHSGRLMAINTRQRKATQKDVNFMSFD